MPRPALLGRWDWHEETWWSDSSKPLFSSCQGKSVKSGVTSVISSPSYNRDGEMLRKETAQLLPDIVLVLGLELCPLVSSMRERGIFPLKDVLSGSLPGHTPHTVCVASTPLKRVGNLSPSTYPSTTYSFTIHPPTHRAIACPSTHPSTHPSVHTSIHHSSTQPSIHLPIHTHLSTTHTTTHHPPTHSTST
jgi:hypothetical protein